MLFLGFFITLLSDDLTVLAMSILHVYENRNYFRRIGYQEGESKMARCCIAYDSASV
jgi:hypothetical protein